MAKRYVLQGENTKLKSEIARLKYALSDLNERSSGEFLSSSAKKPLKPSRKQKHVFDEDLGVSVVPKQKSPTNDARALLDSFESYYKSEEENIEIEGKAELCFADYKSQHNKGERRRERILAEELEKLKEENSFLRSKLEEKNASRSATPKHENITGKNTQTATPRASKAKQKTVKGKKTPRVANSRSKAGFNLNRTITPRHSKRLSCDASQIATPIRGSASATPRAVRDATTKHMSVPASSRRLIKGKHTPKASTQTDITLTRAKKSFIRKQKSKIRNNTCETCLSLLSRGKSTAQCKLHGGKWRNNPKVILM